ncbi:MAG: hypothetical protein A3F69_05075 [Acidobacteria bacterium RIFCSPLOWO2_12_FULL_66_10]|nr:MAG: hypothetical protein A3F69_05075 [Acidobacteria bacterium RIFCSPLOWO2_12_FULL_66_10]
MTTESALVAALRPVADALDAMRVRYYLGGSVASSAHGIARASLDADIVAALEPVHVDPLVGRLTSAYYIPVDRLRSAVAARSSCNFIHLATMFKIDVFVSKGRPFDRQAAERARPQAIDEAPDAPRFPIASPEDTVLAKLEWFRLGGETSERQWWDVVGILRVTEDADRQYLWRWADSLGVADLLERALADAAT